MDRLNPAWLLCVLALSATAGGAEREVAAAPRPVAIRLNISPEHLPKGTRCEIRVRPRSPGDREAGTRTYEGAILEATAETVRFEATARVARSVHRTPILSDLPVIGSRFRNAGVGRQELDGEEMSFDVETIDSIDVIEFADGGIRLTAGAAPQNDPPVLSTSMPKTTFSASPSILPPGAECAVMRRIRADDSPSARSFTSCAGRIVKATDDEVIVRTPDREGRVMHKTPLLGDLPFVGHHFTTLGPAGDVQEGETVRIPVREIQMIEVSSLPAPGDGE